MTFEYIARVLPDGHVPLPEWIPVKASDEIRVTISPLPVLPTVAEALAQHEYLFKHWKGVIQSGLADGAERHDDYLVGVQQTQVRNLGN